MLRMCLCRFIYLFLLLSVFVSTIATSNYYSAQQGSNLLIVAGVNGLDYYPESEVIDLENGGNCDSSWTKFPRDIIGGTGTIFGPKKMCTHEGI